VGWTAAGEAKERRYGRPGAVGEVAPKLVLAEGWSGLSVDLPRAAIEALGWTGIEDLLVAWCDALDAALGRSVGPEGFPRLEPWELVGGVDALDAVQWLGPALRTLHQVEKKRLDTSQGRVVNGGFWLRVVNDPLEDPSDPAARAAGALGLELRRRPASVEAAIDAAQRQRAARAPVIEEDATSCLARLDATLGFSERTALEQAQQRASEAGARDRVVRHLVSCLGRYGTRAVAEAVPLVAQTTPALLAAAPEDSVEAAVRAFAWRDPEEPAVHTTVVLERWLENAEEAPAVLQMLLEADDPDVVRGMVALELVGVQMCACERCADRKRRLAEG
jgi:hypothetical protein